ncbi:hypothetical protein [Sphingobacterium litopenaei]|uniref:Lipocalin-like domain-containing protein n=1 Tax=Sphingobacterium litopenaei TaxID=2763500 RepID=A0ABR7YHI4_9SPHI|nr:hypothetical protein [Sphingobacterium litopenaei]MBD1430726.1 hypothetical protein [Sphingobacterium litopenaei]
MNHYFLLFFALLVFSSCKKDETIEDSFVGEWNFNNYYEYNYCSNCPDPQETTINRTDVTMSGAIYKKIIFLENKEVRLLLNYPHYTAKEEENRGTYMLKNDSIFFNVKEVYFDGMKQTISNNLYIDPELTNTLPFDHLRGRSFKFKFSLQNDKLEIFQQDYDRKGNIVYTNIPSRPSNPNAGNTFNVETRTARTEKVTYQRK